MHRNDPRVIDQLNMPPPGQKRRPAAVAVCKYHPDATLLDDAHAGDLICPECGLVVVERCIDVGSEWRTFGSDSDSKDNSRVGAAENPLLEGGDLSTSIMAGPGGAGYGPDGRLTYNNRRQVSSSDRALLGAFSNIRGMADKLNLPSIIVEHSNKLFQQVHLTKQLKGRSNDAIAAACLYIACRKEDVPRTFKEICAVTVVSKKVIGRVFKLVLKIMNTNVEVTSSGDFMSRFCANLDLPRVVMSCATHIARKAAEMDLVSGRSPISAAAAAIYMASQASEFKKTAAEIGEAAGVAEMTIRQVYKLMLPSAAKLFPEDFNFAVSVRFLPTQ